MKSSKRIGLGVLLVAALLAAAVLVPSMSASPDVTKTKSEKALEYMAQKHGVAKEQLMITNEKEANFPLSNKKIWSVKALDTKTAEVYGVDLDEAGNIADINAAQTLEQAKYSEKYGKKEIELHEKLLNLSPDDMVEVGIWLTPIKSEPKPELEISEKEYKEIQDVKRKAYAQKEKPVLDILKAKNINVRYASQYAPLIYAQVPAKLIVDIEKISEVDGIYLARVYKPSLDMVKQTERVTPVWNAGITGNGIKIGVVEQGKIVYSHPNLAKGSAYNPTAIDDPHATMVAGIIASNHSIYRGMSYGVPGLLSANFGGGTDGFESRVMAASEWAMNNSANILTNSWGDDTALTFRGVDRYFDQVVWDDYRTVIVAAGNAGSTTGNVWSPGLGYNIITVGGFLDNGNSDWGDDTMWSGSSYKDPITPRNDREKPEIVAVASHTGSSNLISLYPVYPWIRSTNGIGTSFAAPSVAGEAALLMQTKSWLTYWPETVKAVIMASADHNLEGNSWLSEYDGAGGIDISKAYETANNNRMSGDVLYANNFPKEYSFPVTTVGQKVRVVINWDSHPDSNHPPLNDLLQSDLDLHIVDPAGNIVGFSSSYDNSYEIVEFTAKTTGTFKARAVKYKFLDPYEYVGFAYSYV